MDNESKEELIIETPNKQNEISKTNTYYTDGDIKFKRINFDNPTSILKYGQDILQESKDMVNKLSALANIEEENPIKFDDMINKLTSGFSELSSVKTSKSLAKFLPETGIFGPVGKVINKVKEKRFESEIYTETYQLEEYNKNIDKLAATIEKKKNNTLISSELDRKIAEKMTTYINVLSLAINVGQQDLDNYIKNIYEVKKAEYEKTKDIDLGRELHIIEQVINLTKKKLNELSKQLLLMENDRYERNLRQGPSFELIIGYESYLTTTIEALRRQGQSIIANKRLKTNQEKLELLNDKSNEVFQKNSEVLLESIEKSIDLSKKGNIYTETLQKLNDNIKAGIDLLRRGSEEINVQIQQDKKLIDSLLSSFNGYENEIRNIFGETSIDSSSFSSNNFTDKDKEDKKGKSLFPFSRK